MYSVRVLEKEREYRSGEKCLKLKEDKVHYKRTTFPKAQEAKGGMSYDFPKTSCKAMANILL